MKLFIYPIEFSFFSIGRLAERQNRYYDVEQLQRQVDDSIEEYDRALENAKAKNLVDAEGFTLVTSK